MKRIIFTFAAALLLSLHLTHGARLAIAAEDTKPFLESDGVVADLRVVSNQAIVRWRLLKLPLSKPLQKITVQFGDEPPVEPPVWPYPAPGERTQVVALLDTTGKARQQQITQQIGAIVLIATMAPAHVGFVVSTYAKEPHVILPKSFDDFVTRLAAVDPEDVEPDLGGVLATNITALGALPAQRRGLFVFTDGDSGASITNDFRPADSKSDAAQTCPKICASALVQMASKAGVALTFVLSPSNRPVDRALLQTLAARTGGEVMVGKEQTVACLKEPFRLLDTGATAILPLPRSSRYFWQSDPIIKATFIDDKGSQLFQLSTLAGLPTASFRQTASDLTGQNSALALFAAGLVVIVGALGTIAVNRRNRGHRLGGKAEPHRHPVFAILQDVKNGNVYSIQTPTAQVGRAKTNEVVIDDTTASRIHAVLVRSERGNFSVENKSSINSTLVNGKPIDQSELSDGDVLTFGSTELRFTRVPH